MKKIITSFLLIPTFLFGDTYLGDDHCDYSQERGIIIEFEGHFWRVLLMEHISRCPTCIKEGYIDEDNEEEMNFFKSSTFVKFDKSEAN